MFCLKPFKRLLRYSDLFCSNEMLRYNNTTQYKTITGGIISITLIIAIISGFYQMILNCVQKTSINYTLQIKKTNDPPRMNLIAGKNKFMIGVSISDLKSTKFYDLINGSQIFDIQATVLRNNFGNFSVTPL